MFPGPLRMDHAKNCQAIGVDQHRQKERLLHRALCRGQYMQLGSRPEVQRPSTKYRMDQYGFVETLELGVLRCWVLLQGRVQFWL